LQEIPSTTDLHDLGMESVVLRTLGGGGGGEGGGGGGGGGLPPAGGLGVSIPSVTDTGAVLADDKKPYRDPNGDIFIGPEWNNAHPKVKKVAEHMVPPKRPGGGVDLPPDKEKRWWEKLYEYTLLTMTLTQNGKPLKDGDKEVGEVEVPDGVKEGPEPPAKGSKAGGKGVYIKIAAVKAALKKKTGKDLPFNDMHKIKCKADPDKKPTPPAGSGGKEPTKEEKENYWVDNNAYEAAEGGSMGNYAW